jgi:hypothetical protein
MTEAEQDVLGEYVRSVANRLWLSDWTFLLSPEEPEREDALASIALTRHRKHGVLYFCSDFRSLKATTVRHCVVHELTHCHEAAMSEYVMLSGMKAARSQAVYDLFWEGYRQHVERTTDALADALSGFMPLIEWPEAVPAYVGRDGC